LFVHGDTQISIDTNRRGKCKVILGPAGRVLRMRLAGNSQVGMIT